MYNDYFGLTDTPFSIAPNPQYLYMSERHREALGLLLYGIKSDGGFLVLTGEVGTGKTTVSRCFLEQVPENVDTAYILNPKLTSSELLATICDDLHIDYDEHASIKILVDKLNEFLLASHQQHRHTVVIIDEAQNLSVEVLEQLRLLTNLETNQRKLLQIILLGQPELLTLLARPELRQLSQRVTARFHLDALTADEVREYIQHRLEVAGAKGMLFPPATSKRVFRITSGIPRLINLVCDRALLGAYVQNQLRVDVKTLNQAALEVLGSQQLSTKNWKITAMAASVAALVVVGLLLFNVAGIQTKLPQAPFYSNQQAPANTLRGLVKTITGGAETGEEEQSSEATVIDSKEKQLDTFTVIEPEAPETTPVAVIIAPIMAIEPVSMDSVQGLASESEAFIELYSIWGSEVVLSPDTDPCSIAASTGLKCFTRLGSLRDVLHINRPVIINLPVQNEPAYFLVTGVTDQLVTLTADKKSFPVDKYEFMTLWDGRYTLLWQLPPTYIGPSKPGDSGATVDWLYDNLAPAATGAAPRKGVTYGTDLEQKIKRFQMSVGLVPDGIVGVQTWIHINSQYGRSIPFIHEDGKG
ncbi:MAG TPA: peptidoglycan-binding protein [Gammaproteobacteria bacterium]|nr:peptidoglycan-binding protein [Gammaproteobacteria bacterium]